MKTLMIVVNLILCTLVFYSGMGLLNSSAASGLELKSSKERRAKATRERVPVEKKGGAVVGVVLRSPEEAARIVAAKNIFDSQRCPNAVGGRGGARSNGTLSLVGIYRVGNMEGAIILTKNSSRSSSSNRMFGRFPTQSTAQNTTQSTTATQQYFRLGETLPNGYILSKVESAQVTLTRGSSKMVLPLAQASANASSGTTRQTRTNPLQQVVQLMQQSVNMQQMQQMNMMRMMRSQPQNTGGGTTRSTNSRGSSSSRSR